MAGNVLKLPDCLPGAKSNCDTPTQREVVGHVTKDNTPLYLFSYACVMQNGWVRLNVEKGALERQRQRLTGRERL